MNLAEFVIETSNQYIRPRIICNDGFSISVQASSGHYCSPREHCYFYSQMELGYPSEEVTELIEYAEDENDLINTVYGYVPCEIIQLINIMVLIKN